MDPGKPISTTFMFRDFPLRGRQSSFECLTHLMTVKVVKKPAFYFKRKIFSLF